MIIEQYDKHVQPTFTIEKDKRGRTVKKYKNTRADKDTRYGHFQEWGKTDLATLERRSIDLLKVALTRSERPVVSCSFGIDSIVTLYLARKAMAELGRDPSSLQVVWNDTKNEFQAVRVYAKKMTELWNLNLVVTAPKKVLKKIIEDNGGIDSSYFTARKGDRRDGQPLSEKCCGTLKHEPMKRAKKENNWDLICVGLRGDESSQRKIAGLRDGEFFYSVKEWNAYVVRPILWWKDKDIWAYVRQENIPYVELYDLNMIKEYPKNIEHIADVHRVELVTAGLDPDALAEQQVQTVTREQARLLKELKVPVFTPRVGCQMCPIPIKYSYLQWMRTYFPKVADAMIHNLGYGKALLELLPQESKDEIKAMTGIDVTAEDAAEYLKDILNAKPCTFDKF
jgi:3'-phosphoadenosine 5'-phosphosulfate sulfotransferase (PAPS reductase)/FAD synthetase